MLSINTDTLRAEVAAHIAADAVVQGHYWKDGKGCFIGCLAHSRDATVLGDRFGLPLPLVRICEGIFEALPADEAKSFFAAVPDAVGVDGKDLSRVHWAFLAEELRALPEVPPEVQAVIDPVIAGMDLLASGQKWPAAARAAADAAADAAYAAYAAQAAYAADAAADAAYAAYAAQAAYAADAAADAAYAARAAYADAAAYAARASHAAAAAADAAARAAARAAAYAADAARAAYAAVRRRQRDTILRLIAAAPLGAQA
jgi:hypothetical protein